MMQFNQSQRNLLQILGDGRCYSGNALGRALGITRSAIWKQINQLTDLGIPITRIPHQGYQLSNELILLDQHHIANELHKKGFKNPLNIHLFTSIDSTNRYLKDLPLSKRIDICCAETQTQGRGRFGRYWYSPFGENIYCSSRWDLYHDVLQLSGLSLITSLAIITTINQLNPSSDIKIKWPNDILWHNKKLCGSLIEIFAESNGRIQVIIGIGLNVNTDTQNHPENQWCSLYEIFKKKYDRNLLIAHLLANLELYLIKFMIKGFNAFIEEWHQFDYLKGKYITVTQSSGSISGTAAGVNQLGQLILVNETGKKLYFSAGDTSLKSTM